MSLYMGLSVLCGYFVLIKSQAFLKKYCLTNAQRFKIAQTFYKNGVSNGTTLHALREDYGA